MVTSALMASQLGCIDPQATHNVDADGGAICESNLSCEEGLVCAGDGRCRPHGSPGTLAAGAACGGSHWCVADLSCNHDGICVQSEEPGTVARNELCSLDADCAANLTCFEGACVGLDAPEWSGVSCPDQPSLSDPLEFSFELHTSWGDDDFFDAPYPGPWHSDLQAWPLPDVWHPLVGEAAASLAGSELDPTGPLSAVVWRASHGFDAATVVQGLPSEAGTLVGVDLTAGADFGAIVSLSTISSAGHHLMTCRNWWVVSPKVGQSWTPGHNYGIVAFRGILRSEDGVAATAPASLIAALGPNPPSDPSLAKTWWNFAPLRAWLADNDIVAAEVIAATTLVPHDATIPLRTLLSATRETTAPRAIDVVVCEPGLPGPFADPDDPDRGCANTPRAVIELQGNFAVPQWQAGEAPYRSANQGGAITWVDNLPVQAGDELITFSLSLPAELPMPAEGWPVVIAVGDRGYRSALMDGAAEALADVVLDDGTHHGFAVLGIDLPFQGPRAASVTEEWATAWPLASSSDSLLHNVLNPRAFRDSVIQGASDLQQTIRLVQSLNWDTDTSPTGTPILFDLERIALLAQGNGALSAVPLAAWAPEIDTLVVSTGLASWSAWGPLRRTPTDSLHDVRTLLGLAQVFPDDPGVIAIQRVFEPADSSVHAGALGAVPTHVMLALSSDDPQAPLDGQAALVRAFGLPSIGFDTDRVSGTAEAVGMLVGNQDGLTRVAAVYGPGSDPHRPWSSRDDALAHLTTWFGTWNRDGVPVWDP